MRLKGALVLAVVVGGALLAWAVLRPPKGRETPPVPKPAYAESAGTAVVVKVDGAGGSCPLVEQLLADPAAGAKSLGDAGYFVAHDPSGRYLAASPRVELPTDAEQIKQLSGAALACVLVDHSLPAQWAARQKGYLSLTQLSSFQRVAATELGRLRGLLDPEGNSRRPGMHLRIGLWRSWQVYVAVSADQPETSSRLQHGLRPPSVPAIAAPPLKGSVLWWSWPHVEADWGAETVSVSPDTYALADLLTTLEEASGILLDASPDLAQAKVAVGAQDAPVRNLIWALRTALGVEVETEEVQQALTVTFAEPEETWPPKERLAPLRGLGYYTPLASGIAGHLRELDGDPDGDGWLGWRFSDLPLMYREMVDEQWTTDLGAPADRQPLSLNPDATFVIWIKTICVSIELTGQGGGGYGSSCYVPAL
jgi:hypothetical protein